MTVAITLDGLTTTDYQRMVDALDQRDRPLAEGARLHVASDTDGQVQVFTVWDDPGAFERFMSERLRPAMTSLQITPPQVRMAPVLRTATRPSPSIEVDKGVTDLFTRLAEHWAAGDARGFAGCYEPDGRLIDPWGEDMQGRDRIAEGMRTIFGQTLSGSTTRFDIQSIRRLSMDLALVDGTQTVMDGEGTTLLMVHATAVVREHDDGSFRLVEGRPHVVPARPGAAD